MKTEIHPQYHQANVHCVCGNTFTVGSTAESIRVAGIDTQVFRLDDGPSQSTGTILDAMKNLPGVTVDQEGKVLLSVVSTGAPA